MNITTIKKSAAAGAILFLFFCGGCGTGEYEQRLDKRINELKTSSKFNILSPPMDVPGTQVSIRVPEVFKNTPLTEGAMVDGKAVDSRRVKPNLIDIPDLKLTFEGFIEDANKGKQPYYLYVAVSSGPTIATLPRTTRDSLSEKLNNTSELTDDYRAQKPEGGEVSWKQCRSTGNQEFYYVLPNTEGQFIQMPGSLELLFHDENNTLVTLAWRMPAGIEQSEDFKSWINLVAGSVKVNP
jgi:hypothetical protein